jgi:hypothetical protein
MYNQEAPQRYALRCFMRHCDFCPVPQAYGILLRPRSAATTPFHPFAGTNLSYRDADLSSRSSSSIPDSQTVVKQNWPTVSRRLLYVLER